jgi:hypothetical protein
MSNFWILPIDRGLLLLHDVGSVADKVVGSISSLVATVDQGSFLNIPGTNTPQVCATATSANCIKSSDVTNWGRYYASVLGLVDNVNVLAVRDSKLQATPLGTNLVNKTWSYAPDFNAQDTWRISKSLTLSYGLSWGWQTPPKENQGQQTVQIDLSTGNLVDPTVYLANKLSAALAGQVYNPTFGWVPVNDAKRSVFNTVYNAVSPRIAFAYSPDSGKLAGDHKTAIRGGFALTYDRSNLVQNVLIPMLGVGFGQTISVNGPSCSACNRDRKSDVEALQSRPIGVSRGRRWEHSAARPPSGVGSGDAHQPV